jgi:hypothetical protein
MDDLSFILEEMVQLIPYKIIIKRQYGGNKMKEKGKK